MNAASIKKNISPNFGVQHYGLNFLVYAFIIIAISVVIFFIYKYVYGPSSSLTTLKVSGEIVATTGAATGISIPQITAGGEYTINFWIYLTSYGTYRQSQRKHLVEIGGSTFSTILIALDATKPTLLVRVHTNNDTAATPLRDRAGVVLDCPLSDITHVNPAVPNTVKNLIDLNTCTISLVKDENLLTSRLHANRLLNADITKFFEPYNIEESLINADAACDVKDIPLQKWVNICTVLNANVCEIYLDGKLVKSCVYEHTYKVDIAPTLKYLQGTPPGFDGYFAQLQVNNTSSNPDDIYKTYLAGPTGKNPTNDPISYIKYMFGA